MLSATEERQMPDHELTIDIDIKLTEGKENKEAKQGHALTRKRDFPKPAWQLLSARQVHSKELLLPPEKHCSQKRRVADHNMNE